METDILLRAILAPLAMAAALLAVPMAVWRVLDHASRRHAHVGVPRDAFLDARFAIGPLVLVPLAAFAHQQGILGDDWRQALERPDTSFGWLPVAVLVAAVLATALDRVARACGVAGTAIASCVVALSAMSLVGPPGFGGAGWRLGAAVIVVLASVGSSAAARGTTRATFVAWWGTLAAASGACLLSGFAKLAVVLGAGSAAAALGAVLCGAFPWVRADAGVGATFAVLLGAGAFLGMGYDERGIPVACWAVIAAAPLAAAAAIPVRGRPSVAAALRAGLPIAVALGAVAAAAALTASAAPDASGY